MPDKIPTNELALSYILSDAPAPMIERLRTARDYLIEVVGPTKDEFSDPEFVENQILPILYERFLSWQAFAEKNIDEDVSVARFCESVRKYARWARKGKVFQRIRPSEYFVETSYAQNIAMFGSRYSSVPPVANGSDEGVEAMPPSRVEGDYLTSFMSEQVIERAQMLMVSFMRLAGSDLGCTASKEYVGDLLKAFEELKLDKSRKLAPFLQLMFQNQTKVHLRAFMYRFEDWFFGAFIDALRNWQEEGLRLLEEGKVEDLRRISAGFEEQYMKGIEYLNNIAEVREGIGKILNDTDIGKPYRDEWRGYMMRAKALRHDYGNFIGSLLLASVDIKFLAEGNRTDASKVKESLLYPFDASSVTSIIDWVLRMASKEAGGAKVSLLRGRMDDIVVPYDRRAAFFRFVNELVRNSIKHRDEKKKKRFVRLESRLEKGEMMVAVTDNGVGIEDLEEAMKWGYRERPDLTAGLGVGLANNARMAKEFGWRFEIESKPGKGTQARLIMRVADWNPPSPIDPDGMGETGGESGDRSLAGAAGASGLASMSCSTTILASAKASLAGGLVPV